MKITLEPIYARESYNEPIESELMAYLREVVYDPLFAILEENMRVNAVTSALRTALSSGQVWYAEGVFTGQFSAAISKELRSLGATLRGDVFELPLHKMPLDLRTAISTSKAKSEALHAQITNTLQAMEANIAAASTGLAFVKAVDKIVGDLQKQFVRSLAVVPDDIGVPADLSEGVLENMRRNLTENANYAIKNFALETTAELRQKVQKNLFAGGRADRLEGLIKAEYGVGQRKAAFIADSEASLAVSQYREARYRALGSTEYVWSTSHDSKVRDNPHGNDHKYLDGRIFQWANPPIVDHATGRRRNPGQDYGPCRCVARPILVYPK